MSDSSETAQDSLTSCTFWEASSVPISYLEIPSPTSAFPPSPGYYTKPSHSHDSDVQLLATATEGWGNTYISDILSSRPGSHA